MENTSGGSLRNVAKRLKEQGWVRDSHCDQSFYRELKRTIPVAAACGGAILGLLFLLGDVAGALDNGTNIHLVVTTIYLFFGVAAKEGDVAWLQRFVL
jgi:protein transport protein SEC61 subunit alpha